MADRIQLRRGTAAQWAANQDKVLLSGEPAAELDQGNKFKIGDGVTAWSQLGYVGGSTNATDIISGTLNPARLSFTKAELDTAVSNGNVMYVGDAPTAHNHAATEITSGTLNDARLSANVPLKNAATEFTNTFTFAGMTWRESNATPAYNDYWRGWLTSFAGINAPHSSNDDTVLRFGFNIDSGGSRINTADAGFADSIESEYWTAGGTNVLERHWEGVTKQGTSFRVLSALIPKNDADRSVSEIASATDRFVMYDWAKNARCIWNFSNPSVNVLQLDKSTVFQYRKNNSYLYQQLNQAENAFINGPFLNTHNVWQHVVKQVYANTDSAHDPGNALLAVRRFGNGAANEITVDVSIENVNNPNLWIGQKWSGVCHGGVEPLIENLSDQSTGFASLRIKTANGGGDAKVVLNTIANTIGLGVDASETAFVVAKSASLGTSNVFTINLSTNLATLANGLNLGTRLGIGSASTPQNYLESVSDGVARIVAQNGSTASELRVAAIQDAADSFKFTVGGRLHIGATAGDAGWLGVQNVINNASSYSHVAIMQAGSGYTIVNCSSGQALDLRVSNSTRLRCNGDGVNIMTNVGFNDTTPIAKPTVSGSRGGNAALASLLTALANYGLITDSTS